MGLWTGLKRTLVTIFYAFVLFTTSTTLTRNPSGALTLITWGPGIVVIAHAIRRDRLGALGWAICGYIATGIALMAAFLGFALVDFDTGVSTELAMAVFLAAALMALYAASLRHFGAARPATM